MFEKHPLKQQPADRPLEQEKKVSILMVEDNPDHALLARKSLERCSHWLVDEAASMSEAFEKMQCHVYQVLLVDYCLPDGYGIDLLDWVDNNCAVVMMTGQGSEKVAVEAFKRGALDYVVKDGLFRETLPEIIEQAMAKNESLKAEKSAQPQKAERLKTAVVYTRNVPVLDGYVHADHLKTLVTKIRRHLTEVRGCIQIVCYNPERPVSDSQQAFLEAALEYCEQLEALVGRFNAGLPRQEREPEAKQ